MKLYCLKTFLSLAENNCDISIHTVLGISRSTMWSHITEIETEVGSKLVNRRKQNTSFTEDGILFIPYAKKIYATFEDSLAHMRAKQGKGIPGEIIISTTKAVADSWLLPGMRNFSNRYPEINVTIVAEDELSKKLSNSADIFLRPMNNPANIRKFWRIVYHHKLFASQEYLNRTGIPKTPEELLQHRIIAYGEQPFSGFESINWHLKGKVYGLPKLTATLSINSTAGVYLAAREGLGICSCPVESSSILGGSLVEILPEIEGPVVSTYFAVRDELREHKVNNIDLCRTYLETYLSELGVNIDYEYA